MAYRNYANNVGFIVDKNGLGDFTTIASALTAATSGTTIFIRPGTYTENLTLVAGVDLCSFGADAFTPNVVINGKCSFSSAGSVSISGIQLRTNSDYVIEVTGSAASVINLVNCELDITNNTAINFTSTSADSGIDIRWCVGDISATGISLFTSSSSGLILIISSRFTNSGNSTTASTASAERTLIRNSEVDFSITTSGTGGLGLQNCYMFTNPANAICVTVGGSGPHQFFNCTFDSGTASAIQVDSTLYAAQCCVKSANTNAITGSGTLLTGIITFFGSSTTINTTTVTKLTTYGGTIV